MTTCCTGIVNLDLSFTAVTDEVIESVAVNLKQLCRLNLQDCMQLTNTSLQSLAKHRASTLEVLWLCDSAHITSDAVVSLKNAVPGLYVHWQLTLDSTESIRMTPTDYACKGVSAAFLSEILYHSQSLQELDISMVDWGEIDPIDTKCASITGLYFSGHEEVALDVISLCPNLRKLDVNFMVQRGDVADSTLVAIAEKSSKLRYLAIQGVHCNLPAYIAMTTICTDIVNLDLSYTTVTDEVIESVAVNMQNLCRLNLQNCGNLTNASLHSLATHSASTLQSLWLSLFRNITSDAIISLKAAVPGLLVHWQLTLDSVESSETTPTDYAVCTVLYSYRSMQDTLPIALRCKLLTVLCVFDQKKSDTEFTIDNMTQLVRCCPQLRTIIVRDSDLQAMQTVVVRVANYIAVTSSTACLSASLQEFPI
eukprot:gene9573-11256_t